ncbi:MAG: transposase [Balneolaceae bacterium]|nr:transposase [Balneolaceae bacterium]
MIFLPSHIYHLYNQGNNRQTLFSSRENYLFFISKIRKLILPHAHILAWCLMPNHYHILLKVHDKYPIKSESKVGKLNKAIGTIQSSYTRAINKKSNRSGSLFRQRAKAKSLDENHLINDNYLINCFLYIHQNPLRAGLVDRLESWTYSSYLDYAGLRNGDLCNKELALELMALNTNLIDFKLFSQRTIPAQFYQNFE